MFKVVFGVWGVLFLGVIGYAQRKVMREHRSRFAQCANEYRPLVWVCIWLGFPLGAFLIDWLASMGSFPWASAALPLRARWRSG